MPLLGNTQRAPWLVYLWIELELDRGGPADNMDTNSAAGKIAAAAKKGEFPAANLGKPTTATKISTTSRYDIGKESNKLER